ncbi:rhomboid family intramembrane serine protease [Planctobacterium marinum]|uniref:Peptidase S54 rhomboid domain-containing protein n=1 Tax=Planctobacterium marinum TaxID=1631968 RepID=A0AA48HH61_9ALTE|nr:hypothetical protein MACH26_23540 [Planctobacterium marinum]
MSELNNVRHGNIRQAIMPGFIFVVILWLIKTLEFQFGFSLHQLGVFPGAMEGLIGILTGPLIHGSYEHLASNSLALLLLLAALFYGYPNSKYWTLATIWLGSGLGTWLFAREAWHFGASGLTHGLFFYLFVISILRRDKRSIALMMMVFFMYGGMIMTIFPREPGISYEYHFFGALFGLIAALIFKNSDPKPIEKQYGWEIEDKEDELIGDEWQTEQDQEHTIVEEEQHKLH